MAKTKEVDTEITVTSFDLVKVDSFTAIASNRREQEDVFKGMYTSALGDVSLICPSYVPTDLEEVVQRNNTLSSCIEAMVNNIDGTGYKFEKKDAKEDENYSEDAAVKRLTEFFDQPYPGISFHSMRIQMREDLEKTGNAYLEVMRNLAGEIVFARPIESRNMRLVRLDAPVPVTISIMRNGKEETFEVMMRERRYAQKINEKVVYFRDFNSSRELDKMTGQWEGPSAKVDPKNRATEIIHFTLATDYATPYGIPRWVHQMPSAVGSRKAEEHNLRFFDTGGLPPILMIVEGGQLAPKMVEELKNALNSNTASKHQAHIVEAYPTGGSIENSANVRVKVERFGSERMSDAMFENYDERCEKRVRQAFRLPPIFVGKSEDYNFASAQASYMVAEAQVFKPERDEFDDIITKKLLPEMGGEEYCFRSNPIVVKNAELQVNTLLQIKESDMLDEQKTLELIGVVADLDLTLRDPREVEQEREESAQFDRDIQALGAGATPQFLKPANDTNPPAKVARKRTTKADYLAAIAESIAKGMSANANRSTFAQLATLIGSLTKEEQQQVKTLLAAHQYLNPAINPEDMADLMGCSFAVAMANAPVEQ